MVDPSADGLLSRSLLCMFYVYVILNQNGKLYTGHTEDLKARLKRHNGELPTKATSYTSRNKGVWQIVYNEEFHTRKEAMVREKELKTSTGRRFIKSILEGKI